MYVNGHGISQIVEYLNNNKYSSPTWYRKTGLIKCENNSFNKEINHDLQDTFQKFFCRTNINYAWNQVTLCNMLKNEVYIGNTVQNKKTVVSYKIKKIRKVEKENQIRVNNTHDSIIDKDIFEKVQCILEKRVNNTKLKYNYLLRGLLYCNHCKRKLQIVLKNNSKKNNISHPYITCSNYKKRNCYPLSINYEKFEKYIIDIVKNICRIYADKETFYSIYEKINSKVIESKKILEKKIENANKEILNINNNIDKMYIDKLQGTILEEDYIRMSQKFNFEREKLNEQKKKLEEKLIETEKIGIKNRVKKEKELEEVIENFLKFDKIEKIYLYKLIKKVEIDKEKNVYIYFNFSRPNSINKNIEKFIRIEELFEENMQEIS